MALNPKLVQHGTVGGTPINVDVTRLEHNVSVRVQLSGNYARVHPPGMPSPPDMTGVAALSLDFPKTIPSGTVMRFLKAEADALVAAAAASYV